MSASTKSEFVVVANRLPVDRVVDEDGEASWRRSPGGLVTAIVPVMQRRGGAWVGWVGAPDEDLEPFSTEGMDLVPIRLSAEEVERYYEGFSNATLWPLYHDVVATPVYKRTLWEAYVRVNRRFAEAAAEVAAEGAIVWIQDYQLQLVPKMLRELRPDLRIGFFLHIPFPPMELFVQLPWRKQIIEGLLGADLVGFQTADAAANFSRLCKRLAGAKTQRGEILVDDRVVRAEAHPISVDVNELIDLIGRPEVRQRAAEIRAELGNPGTILLGVDRLDYTKGIRQRLQAFSELFRDGRLKSGDAVFVQIATPSRERVEEYRRLRNDIELYIGRANGLHSELGAPIINYLHTSYTRDELAALFLAADVMVVTPLRDGMNLVAKEYVACRADLRGSLVLSEFAGAAEEMKRAFLVNPYDIDGMKQTLLDAMNASPAEQHRRMRALRKRVIEYDVDRWAHDFLEALERPHGSERSFEEVAPAV
ncbi:alpha,alpha-trehalose-phosphate synthase (UDP-forming) [Actinoallomurus rhizosphaericola]|uniref:alpha,alpha-trehalose-phosphate synthase (UDP-forming) n=1 Tax=Actinoallomurus rhizosphaericola TaxID=2952536 RepID=UPI002093E4EE|nr:trehalose-6-phosphate synthase [Actinoallomurus rhizosphaericola]MCO5996067.1 trehalose-6-phosphate synthase [Actinoallomurus rhizosphaericola]